jgi:hypothetical protein
MRLLIFILLVLHFVNHANGQDKVIFHKYEPTASSWNIIEWNTKDTLNTIWIVKETIDNKGRVSQLEFLKKGKLINDHLCYLANKVTFEYSDNLIIQTLYSGDLPLMATDCEVPYKTIFHLDKENYIEKIEIYAKYDFNGMDSNQIAQWKKWVPEYRLVTSEEKQLHVDYYYHSYAMFNGVYPVSRNYELIDNYFYGDEPEKSSIIIGIDKLRVE